MTYPTTALNWRPAYRVIPSRFPSIGLFERVASPADFDALYTLEAMTNPRIRAEVGEISLVPADERLFGPGSTCIMAAFTHRNPHGSRFSDGSYGVFYCARKRDTAIAETRHHAGIFMQATREPPMRLQMRLYSVDAQGKVADLRKAAQVDPRIVDPDDYSFPQSLGRQLKDEGARGIVYPSVRHLSGVCLAAFSTRLLKNCGHAAYLEYNWNGQGIDAVFEVSQLL